MLDLSKFDEPLEEARFTNGSVHRPIPFGVREYKIWRALMRESDEDKRLDMLIEIVKGCYPTATDEDIGRCTFSLLMVLAAHAAGRIEQVQEALKNADAVEPAEVAAPPQEATAPSTPKTSGATSSPKSHARRGKTGGTSTTASLTASPT